MSDQTRRDYYQRRKGEMDTERTSFIPHYKDISQFISPRRGRFGLQDQNKGGKRHQFIINSTGTQALTTARAGMFGGVMSPARPWMALTFPDPELALFPPVKHWLRIVTQEMLSIFNQGNLYVMAPVMIGELLLFGTGCITHEDDDENLARFFTHTAGSYMIAQNNKFETNVLCREFMMTAEQMAVEFGKDKVSLEVKNALHTGNMGAWFPVTQFIEPNEDFRPNNPFAKFKAFTSVKYEPGNNDKDAFLSQSGFDEFPAYVPRWGLTGEDVYGTECPGMVTLGDVKQLQIEEKRKAQGIDKQVNPPLTGPASLRNVPVSSLPGGLTIHSGDASQNKLEAIYNVNINLADLKEDIRGVEQRIKEAFFVDLFLAISNMEGIQPRNEFELSQRNAERLLQLGPVLERLQGEFLDRLVQRTFNQMVRAGLVPPAPEEIQGQPLKVEYISSLALAQRSVDVAPIDRFAQFTGGLVEAGLSDGKVFDGDGAMREYAQLTGVPPAAVTDPKIVEGERAAEAQQRQMAAAAELGEQTARAAASAGQVDMSGNNPVANVAKASR